MKGKQNVKKKEQTGQKRLKNAAEIERRKKGRIRGKQRQPRDKNRATTANLPHRRHNNHLVSLSTTTAPLSAGRKPSETGK